MIISNVVEVTNKNGLHTRPAGILCNIANKPAYAPIGIFMVHNGIRVDAKSILNVLTLGATHGTKIIIEVEGEESDKKAMESALHDLTAFFESAFNDIEPEVE